MYVLVVRVLGEIIAKRWFNLGMNPEQWKATLRKASEKQKKNAY